MIEAHDIAHAGAAAATKLKSIAATLEKQGADAAFVADPASVCWALNIRGSDVPFTPFPLAYALLRRKGKAELFADAKRLTAEARAALKDVAVCKTPSGLQDRLAELHGKAVSLDPNHAPEAVRLALLKAGAKVIEAQDPCLMPKARKNATEQQGAREAQRRDGGALTRFLKWVADNGADGDRSHSRRHAARLSRKSEPAARPVI